MQLSGAPMDTVTDTVIDTVIDAVTDPLIAAVIEDFAQGLGLADFRWAASNGLAVFAFERRGTLYLEQRTDELLVYLGRELDLREHGRARLTQALHLCHYRHQWPFVIQAGLRQESQLVFIARLARHEVSLPALEQALELLTRLHDQTLSVG